MKRTIVTIACLTFASLLSISAMAKESSEAAIRATDVVFAAAWNHHDVPAMAATWAKDGDLINPSGRLATGRAAIEQLMTGEHATAFKSSTYTPGTLSIRFIEPDIAITESETAISGVTNPDGTIAPTMNVHILRVVEKKDGRWLTVSARPVIYPVAPVAK